MRRPTRLTDLRRGMIGLTILALMGMTAPSTLQAQLGDVYGHDPAIIEHEGIYYMFTTGRGVGVRRSADLVRWENVGTVFAELPAWTREAVPAVRGSLWAPDISYFSGRYHLYYSVSSFGSQRSAIGLATSRTLDPADAAYGWEDHGPVVRSYPGVSTFNAIDPNLALDADGQPWLSWGSFWGGIKMRQVNPATGLLSESDTTLYSLAARRGTEANMGPDNDQSIEAPFIVRRGDYYYLFASYDMCCRGVRSTYNIRVGRSEAITGPYLDERGELMTRGGGDVVLASAGRVRGPGHNSVLVRGDEYFLVHHMYDSEDQGRSRIQIRPIMWIDDWPAAGLPLTELQ